MMDNYRSRLIALHEAQTQKGIDKYGTVLEQNTDDVFKRLEHFRQEMLDGLNYSFWLEDEIRKLVVGKSCDSCDNWLNDCCQLIDARRKICMDSDHCFWEQGKSKQTEGQARSCETCGDKCNNPRYTNYCKSNNYEQWMPRPEVTD